MSNLPKPPRPGVSTGQPPLGEWRGSSYRPIDENDSAQRARLIEEFKRERAEEAKKKPTQTQLMEKAVMMAGARAVEAMRYGMRHEEVLARILQAMDEELCKTIHDE